MKKGINKDILKRVKKKQRDEELFDENGWKQTSKVHKTKKQYSRKQKYKNFNIEEDD
jgi:hypothetical protein